MRYLILILLTLSVSCGEETSKPVKRKEKEEDSQEFDTPAGEERVWQGGSDEEDLEEGCCDHIDLEALEQIEVTYDRPELDLYRDTFVRPSLPDLDFEFEVRDFGLDLD